MEVAHQQVYNTKKLLDIYIEFLIHSSDPVDLAIYRKILTKIQKKYASIFTLWIKLDENTEYLHLILSGRVTESSSIVTDPSSFCIEDRNWMYATCKHITYYNKRYLFPM